MPPTTPCPCTPKPPPPSQHLKLTQFLLPATLLLLIPKCPMCLAAYITLFTGITLGVTTAQTLHTLLPILCLTTLALLTFVHLCKRPTSTPSSNS